MKKKLVLIDGHAILHRAYHALPKTLTNRHGQMINAAYGFTRMILRVIEDLKPEYLAVAFDRPEPTFRHKEFMGYQVQRPKMDSELKDQIQIVKEVLKAFSIPALEKIGFEADDVIGTLASQAQARNLESQISNFKITAKKSKLKKRKRTKIETIIVTGDRDIFQLIDKSTVVYAPIRGFSQAEIFGRQKVKKNLGVWPKQIVDYKALVGDSSDNYPGVPGIGPKTAVELLRSFKSLEKIYRNLGKVRGSVRKKLEVGKESALLSQKLARIVTDVPVKLNLKKCRLDYDLEKVLELFGQLGFRSLVKKLKREPGEPHKIRRKQPQQKRLFL